MNEYKSLNHTRWECKYHIVFIPKCRKKSLFGQIREELGPMFKELASRKEVIVEEGYIMRDHVHMLLSVPPEFSVAQVVGFIKGKSAIQIAQYVEGRKRNFVSTVGRDEKKLENTLKIRRMKINVLISWDYLSKAVF